MDGKTIAVISLFVTPFIPMIIFILLGIIIEITALINLIRRKWNERT